MRWMRCHLTGPAGRPPAPQHRKLVNMETNYCCPCDQSIIQPYHDTHARPHARARAICADQQQLPLFFLLIQQHPYLTPQTGARAPRTAAGPLGGGHDVEPSPPAAATSGGIWPLAKGPKPTRIFVSTPSQWFFCSLPGAPTEIF